MVTCKMYLCKLLHQHTVTCISTASDANVVCIGEQANLVTWNMHPKGDTNSLKMEISFSVWNNHYWSAIILKVNILAFSSRLVFCNL